MNWTGRRVLITGAGKGIGRATAVMLAKRGATVITLTRNPRDLATLAEEIMCQQIEADLGALPPGAIAGRSTD